MKINVGDINQLE